MYVYVYIRFAVFTLDITPELRILTSTFQYFLLDMKEMRQDVRV